MSSLGATDIQTKASEFAQLFDQWLGEYLESKKQKANFVEILWQSKAYSLKSGGKRFRPFLACLVYQIWNQDLEKMKNFCLAMEMIHTYSLIHDDLPCMDNDDLRRGKPTNHKVYGEATALLAGDSLLTEAFNLICRDSLLSADVSVKLMRLVSERIGAFGMVGGQVLDMNAKPDIAFADLETIHRLKTGYLIQSCAQGAALIGNAEINQFNVIGKFALNLGLAFQIKDDLLDADDNKQDHKSYLAVLGRQKTLDELNEKSAMAIQQLKSLNIENANSLIALVEYNLQRTI